jgi:hypothetical protein
MNCTFAREQILRAAYDELPEAQRGKLAEHLASCEACRQEQREIEKLLQATDALPVAEPDANLTARARIRLNEALDALPPTGWTDRLATRVRNGFFGLRAAPLAALSLLIVGIAAGTSAGFELAQLRTAHQNVAVASLPAPARVASTETAAAQPQKAVATRTAAHQPVASQPQSRAAEERDHVETLAAACRAERGCRPSERATLIAALRNESNPKVREAALEGLEPYVAEDLRVRNAILRALLNDSDPRIRTASINLLEPVDADTSVRQVLYSVSNSDANPQIRNVSRQVLSRMPEIQ